MSDNVKWVLCIACICITVVLVTSIVLVEQYMEVDLATGRDYTQSDNHDGRRWLKDAVPFETWGDFKLQSNGVTSQALEYQIRAKKD